METKPTSINRVAVGDIIRRPTSLHPDKIAFIEGERRITFGELDRRCNQFAHYLRSKGLSKGDAVAALCGNSLDFIISAYGIARAGMVWVPMNTLLKREQLDYILDKVEARLLIVDTAFLPVMQGPGRTPPPRRATRRRTCRSASSGPSPCAHCSM